jgi:hypothetical protein
MKSTVVYLLVGGKIKTAQARIVGKIAEVQTPYGIREFGTWFETYDQAKLAKDRKALMTTPIAQVPCGLPGSAALDILDCLQDRPVAAGKSVLEKSVRLQLAACNWTCARANTCHEYECDGESHFVPKETLNVKWGA